MPTAKQLRLLNQDHGATTIGTAQDLMDNSYNYQKGCIVLHTTEDYNCINSKTLIFRPQDPDRNVQLYPENHRVNKEKLRTPHGDVQTKRISSITKKKPKKEKDKKDKVPSKNKRRFAVQI